MLRRLAFLLLFLILAILSLWAAAALYLDFGVPVLRIPAAILYLIAITILAFLARKPILAAGPCFATFAVLKSDLPVFQFEEPLIGDGDPVRIAAQISQHLP